MPLYNDTSLYSQTVPSYALYLSSPYSGHSSLIGSYTRPTFAKSPLTRFHRNFAPHLAPISENQVTSLRRKYSPQIRINSSKYTVPKPIKINTADIDVSANKYKQQVPNKERVEKEEVPKSEEVKPIRRDRATVRLHTFHKDNKDGKRWRQNFNSFELNTDNTTKKKEEEEKNKQERQLPKSPSFHDICEAISTGSINEELNPGQPREVVRKQSRTYSKEDLLKHIRRNSTEILKDNIDTLDQIIQNEDINNNELKRAPKADDTFESRGSVRKRKKVAKKKSQDLVSQQKETEELSTPPPLQRRNTKKASFKDISQVEVEEIRKKPKPLFTATVDVEEPKPNLKLIIDDVKVEETPKLKPKKFKLNVTVQVDEKPKVKKKVEDKGKMYIPNSKPALVTDIKKKEQRGSLGDICEGIEEMPKLKSKEKTNKALKKDGKENDNSELNKLAEIDNSENVVANNLEIDTNKLDVKTNKLGSDINDKKKIDNKSKCESKEADKSLKEIDNNNADNKLKETNIEPREVETDKITSLKTDGTDQGKLPRSRMRKEENALQKLTEKKPDVLLKSSKSEENVKSKLGDPKNKDEVKTSLKWNQKLCSEDPKISTLSKESVEETKAKQDIVKPILKLKPNQASESLEENAKPKPEVKSPKTVELKQEPSIPKWKQDLKKRQQAKEEIKSIMKGNKQDEKHNYKKSVSIEEKPIIEEEREKGLEPKEDNPSMDFWDIIGTGSSVYESKPVELKTIPVTQVKEERDEVTNEEEKAEVSPLKLVSKRSLVNKATNEDPDLQVFAPPPKPPTPEPQPESFVPLQSNRLSNWMHPFKKPEQFDECPIEIYATPKTIRKRHYPKPRVPVVEQNSSEETSSEGDSSEEEDENIGKSTSSNDSGFNSSNGRGQNRKDNDCDVNIHRKCEKLTANLCGINQKLIVEAIQSVKRAPSDTRDSPTSNPAHNPAFALDACDGLEDFQMSSTYVGFQKSGRITPPATTIPRFRKYTIDDFNFLKVLGKGSFGKVLLAELRDTEYYYAIKCLKKDVVLEDDDVECTLIERKVLALGTKHPYLCHLLCTFQTESHLFFVMEYLNGGDLMFHIQQSGRFPEPRARFYGAEIVSGLRFLHSKGIVYRDLKLDNVLLDFDGHVRIADFGMCKLQIFLDRMADTFCGTPDYMAPEIIKGQHYNQCVDWWSFGVLLYEMLIGQSPFSGCDEDELFWSICNEKPVFPRFLSGEANSVLTQLLEKDWNKRLGNKLSPHGDIQDHQFFRPISWDLLEMRQMEAPFKPNLQHPLDTQYFDKTFTVEKAKLTPIEKNILQSMDQTQFQGFSYTNPNATDR